MLIEEITQRIFDLSDEIDRLTKERQKLDDMVKSMTNEDNTRELLRKIYSVNDDNSTHKKLYPDTKTTPIMDQFYSSNKQFLIFDRAFHLSAAKHWMPVSLVITKRPGRINIIDSGLTMTNLKQFVGASINENLLCGFDETTREHSLIKELLKASESISKAGDIASFETPIRLGGQTYANQTGYGSEYNGDVQVYQGTLYGETTGFCIIGIIA